MRGNLALVIDSSGTSQTRDYAVDALVRGMGRFIAVEETHLVDWSILHPSQDEMKQARYRKAAQFLDDWLSSADDYDEKVSRLLEIESKEPLQFGSDDE